MVTSMIQELSHAAHCDFSLHYHLVIVTKHRKRVLTQPMISRFTALAGERADAWGGQIVEVNGEADHIHLLLSLPPSIALADFVNALKTGTSRRLRGEFGEQVNRFYRKPVLWSRSYCVISCAADAAKSSDGAPPGADASAKNEAEGGPACRMCDNTHIIKRYIEGQNSPSEDLTQAPAQD